VNGEIHLINDKTFEKEVLQDTQPVLVDYWANWCDTCQMISPALEQIAEAYASHIKVARLNIDESDEVLMKYGIHSIPTFMLFRNGEIIATQVGTISEGQLIGFIEGNVFRAWPFY